MNKAIFLDRDGVLNQELGDYVCKVEDFHVLEHNFETLKELKARGFIFVIITNQGGIAKGWYNEVTLDKMHDELRKAYAEHGIVFEDAYYCRHHPLYNGNCLCRKPGSIMLEKAIARFNVEKTKSYFIGDKETDVLAGQKAGVTGILITSDQPLAEIMHLIV